MKVSAKWGKEDLNTDEILSGKNSFISNKINNLRYYE